MNGTSNLLQPLSAAWAATLDTYLLNPTSSPLANDLILYGVVPYSIALGVFLGCTVYANLLDAYAPKWFYDRYKIEYSSGAREQYGSMRLIRQVAFAHFWLGITSIGGFQLIKWFTTTSREVSLMLPVHIFLMLVIDDIWFYWVHRAFHVVPYLWQNIHSIHHEMKYPTAFAAAYMSPIEIIGTVGIGTLLAGTVVKPDFLTFLTYVAIRTFTTVDPHNGWMLPFNPMNFLPFIVTVFDHDLHHHFSSYQGHAKNLASVFTPLDHLFGTYSAFKPKLKFAKNSGASNASRKKD
ncbi:fatty acid hydroxylase superfamily-domain-containing protein [Zopfochytrium polystomum]|nr:fatty acid hydroxylase superfamily-domain-containing protein [Zopfochytrium polystomum]